MNDTLHFTLNYALSYALSQTLPIGLAWLAGGVLGAIFFGGLWWTVRHVIASTLSAVWLVVGLLLRMGIALAGFYVVSDGQWQRLLACLLGFLMARALVTYLTRPLVPTSKGHHAS